MVWFVLAGMAACAVLAAVWPLLRAAPSMKADPAANEAAFYKAQLEEIKRDVERGLLPQGEAESARAEAARRLIAVASGPSQGRPAADRRYRLAAAALIAVGLPAIAFPLYARIGQPAMPDEPLASRRIGPHSAGEIEAAVAAVERRLIAKPDDGKGWAVIAPVYMRLERYSDAAHAYVEALRLLGEDPSAPLGLWRGPGRRRGRRRHRRSAPAVRSGACRAAGPAAGALLYGARDRAGRQEGGGHSGLPVAHRRFAARRAMASLVNARLAALEGKPAPAQEAAAVPEAQRPMIEGMVNRLATRLASKGGSVDEWSRLIRAYTVLHEADKAKAALADAHKALASNANAVASLDALARDLGLGDAN